MENFKSFVAIDFETLQAVATDGMLYNHLPIQVGMVKCINGELTGEYINEYINPPVEGSWESHWKIGIDSSDCEGAPSYADLHERIVEFVGDLPLVAFNSSTEWWAMVDACDFYNLELPFERKRFVDPYTQLLIRYNYPKGKSYPEQSGLACWVESFGLWQEEWEEHRAIDDAKMLAKLYLHLQTIDVDSVLQRKESNAGWFHRKEEQKDMSLFEVFVPEEEVLHPDNPFNRKYICLTGFEREVENILNRKIMSLGAAMLDNPKAKMNILIPSNESMSKYGCPPKGKIAESLRKGKHIMNVNELKEILCTFDMYEGELE